MAKWPPRVLIVGSRSGDFDDDFNMVGMRNNPEIGGDLTEPVAVRVMIAGQHFADREDGTVVEQAMATDDDTIIPVTSITVAGETVATDPTPLSLAPREWSHIIDLPGLKLDVFPVVVTWADGTTATLVDEVY